jgi:hypothetical protein
MNWIKEKCKFTKERKTIQRRLNEVGFVRYLRTDILFMWHVTKKHDT